MQNLSQAEEIVFVMGQQARRLSMAAGYNKYSDIPVPFESELLRVVFDMGCSWEHKV